MSRLSEITSGETVLKKVFVDDDYFLIRVQQFEQKYKLGWGEFLVEYDSGRLDPERDNRDFVEWSFLCRTFLRELVIGEGPPGDDIFPEKPELNSGFCIMGSDVPHSNVRSRRLHRSTRESLQSLPQANGRIGRGLAHRSPERPVDKGNIEARC